MAQATLVLGNIGDLGGGAAELVIEKLMRQAIDDLLDRGEQDEKPRIVDIRLIYNLRRDGTVEIDVESKLTLPKYRCPPTILTQKSNSGGETILKFSTHSPEEPRQNTIE